MNRLLLFLENYKRESSGEVGCKFILDLPPPEASDVRLEVCRCMGVERHEAGTRICKQVRAVWLKDSEVGVVSKVPRSGGRGGRGTEATACTSSSEGASTC